MNTKLFLTGLLAAGALATHALAATTLVVPATGDLFLAGAASGTACCNQDSAPTESPTLVPLALGPGEILTFSATGEATYEPGPLFPRADGQTGPTYDLTADYGTGISGATGVHLAGLAGVLLNATQPSGPAPAQLSGTSFASISPGLDQIFFIGDGLTGTGTCAVQQFVVPTGATRLYFGVADNGYYDNSGSLTVTVSPLVSGAPEPSTWALMVAGVGVVGLVSRRAQRIGLARSSAAG